MSLLRPAARRFAWAVALPVSLFAVAAAWAGTKEEMKAMGAKFLAARSYHATMTSSDKRVPKTEMDFVAPDRYRLDSGMGPQVVIGDTMYMTVGGNTMRIPMPKGMLTQWRQTDRAFREIDRAQIEALGSESVDGKPARKYRMIQTFDGVRSDTLLWVGANDLPIRMETTGTAGKRTYTTTIVYSRFNDPSIRIDAPK